MDRKTHWDGIYTQKSFEEVSWYQAVPTTSLQVIADVCLAAEAPIIDIGGGDAYLAEQLMQQGHQDVSVLDISHEVLARAQKRLGDAAQRIHWLCADITHTTLPSAYAFWHDRAVFHFLTQPDEQARYIALAGQHIQPQGHLLMATFAEDGPEKCSGIPVQRYNAESLQALFAQDFDSVKQWREVHTTPFQTQQAFTFVLLQRKSV